MSDKLFGNNGQSQVQDDNSDVDYVAHFFGDKAPTEDDYKEIIKGKYFADQHVKTLEIENKGLRKMEETSAKFEQLLNQLSQKSTEREASKEESQAPIENQKRVDSEMTPDKIQELINQHLNTRQEQTTKQRNLEKVKAKAEEVFGRNYESELLKRSKELGASLSFVESIASTNPDAFFKMMGMDQVRQPTPSSAPPRTNMDAARSGLNNQNVKNYAYYSKLRKSDPNAYKSKAVQSEMHIMAAKLGSDFYA